MFFYPIQSNNHIPRINFTAYEQEMIEWICKIDELDNYSKTDELENTKIQLNAIIGSTNTSNIEKIKARVKLCYINVLQIKNFEHDNFREISNGIFRIIQDLLSDTDADFSMLLRLTVTPNLAFINGSGQKEIYGFVLYIQGKFCLRTGTEESKKQGINFFKAALQTNSGKMLVPILNAEMLYRSGEYQRAANILEHHNRTFSNTRLGEFKQCLHRIRQIHFYILKSLGKWKQLEEELDHLPEEIQKRTYVLARKADLAVHKGELDTARARIKDLEERYPYDLKAKRTVNSLKCQVYFAEKNFEEALCIVFDILENSEFSEKLYNDTVVKKAQAILQFYLKDFESSLDNFNEILQKNGKDPEAIIYTNYIKLESYKKEKAKITLKNYENLTNIEKPREEKLSEKRKLDNPEEGTPTKQLKFFNGSRSNDFLDKLNKLLASTIQTMKYLRNDSHFLGEREYFKTLILAWKTQVEIYQLKGENLKSLICEWAIFILTPKINEPIDLQLSAQFNWLLKSKENIEEFTQLWSSEDTNVKLRSFLETRKINPLVLILFRQIQQLSGLQFETVMQAFNVANMILNDIKDLKEFKLDDVTKNITTATYISVVVSILELYLKESPIFEDNIGFDEVHIKQQIQIKAEQIAKAILLSVKMGVLIVAFEKFPETSFDYLAEEKESEIINSLKPEIETILWLNPKKNELDTRHQQISKLIDLTTKTLSINLIVAQRALGIEKIPLKNSM